MNKPISDTYLLCRENAKAKGGISAGVATQNWVICANDLEINLWAGARNEIKYVFLAYGTWILLEAHILNYWFINNKCVSINLTKLSFNYFSASSFTDKETIRESDLHIWISSLILPGHHIARCHTSLMPGVIVGAAIKTTKGANSAVLRTFNA